MKTEHIKSVAVHTDLNTLLIDVAAEIDELAQVRAISAERLAPDFNVLQFYRHDELRLSKFFAWLLDPRSTHSQGARFLQAFVDAHLGWEDFDAVRATVCVEAQCGQQRRLDILVRSGNAAFAIENKPWAVDQANQVTDYLTYLDRFPTRCLIYLTGTEARQPSAMSISAAERTQRELRGELRYLDYTSLGRWLGEARCVSRAERVSAFIDDLQSYILTTFGGVGDMTEKSAVIERITRDPASLRAASRVAEAWSSTVDALLARLVDQLAAEVPAGWAVESDLGRLRYSGVTIIDSARPHLRFRLQFDQSQLGDAVYGVVLARPDKRFRPIVQARLEESEFGRSDDTDSSNEWAWWRYANEIDQHLPIAANWWFAGDTWTQVEDGSLALKLVRLAQHLLQQVSDL